jgi:hypothetical protein
MSKAKWDVQDERPVKQGKVPVMTLMVDLPSKGLYYSEDSFLHNLETVEIKYVSGLEEAILTNKEYAKNGVTIDKFVQSLFIDDRMKLPSVMNSLMLCDITAIAIAGRNSAYGNDYSVKVTCPKCGHVEDIDFDFSDLPTSTGFKEHDMEGEVEWLGEDKFKILETPLMKNCVVFRLLNHKDELNVRKIIRTKKQITFKEQYQNLILSVDGIGDNKTISDFLDNTPAFDLKYIRNIINKCTPSMDLKKSFSCSACPYTQDSFEVPITENFFLSL